MKQSSNPLPTRSHGRTSRLVLGVLLTVSTAAWSGPPQPAQLGSPVRLAQAGNGNLVVTDYEAKAVVTINPGKLNIVKRFSVAGRPLGIAWSRGRIYVGNETTGTVEVYNPAGKWLYDLGGGKGTVKQPRDIAVERAHGRVFVIDGEENSVKVFDARGPLLDVIGKGQLINPTGIALDVAQRQVLVSDYGDPAAGRARIAIFDYAGNPAGEISGADRRAGFSRPQGLAVAGSGHVFVVDGVLGEVLVFDRISGERVKTLGGFGNEPGQLRLPLDIVIHPVSNDVFVTNNRLRRVEVFTRGGLLP